MVNYLAFIHKKPKSDFGVSFPDFPGCVTTGATLDEAKDMAHDALSLYVKGNRSFVGDFSLFYHLKQKMPPGKPKRQSGRRCISARPATLTKFIFIL